MTQQIDSQAIKDQQKQHWGSAAAGWRKNHETLRQTTAPVTEKMLSLAAVAPGQRVLDIACGSGEPAIPAAKIVGTAGSVLATDISPEMIEVAREKAKEQGITNIEFRLVDGEELDVEPNSFDAVTCRWGIMFMPEPVRCLKQAHRALKPGGRICAAVWGPMERNPFFTVPMGVLRQHVNVPAPAPGRRASSRSPTRANWTSCSPRRASDRRKSKGWSWRWPSSTAAKSSGVTAAKWPRRSPLSRRRFPPIHRSSSPSRSRRRHLRATLTAR